MVATGRVVERDGSCEDASACWPPVHLAAMATPAARNRARACVVERLLLHLLLL